MIDWDDAFDNSGYVPGAADLPARWAQAAAQFRDVLVGQGRAELDIAYGGRTREQFDLFLPQTAAEGCVVFVHGGYWHKFDKSYWSHLAAGPLAHRWAVVMPSYPLAPSARLSQMTEAMTRAIGEIARSQSGPLILVGHSAGGHLMTRMMCRGVLADDVSARVRRVVTLSGVHHLDPLLATRMNETLQITANEAMSESPVHLDPIADIPLSIVVGDQERPEFLRQSRMLAERWSAKGVQVDTIFAPGQNHFNVIDGLGQPDSDLVSVILD